jgi:hypothetical protein
MTDGNNNNKHATLLNMWRYAVSFVIGVIIAAFTVGTARQKVREISLWKDETAPRIERMDATGTLSFAHFHAEYQRTQARQEEALKDLDKRLRELERKQ